MDAAVVRVLNFPRLELCVYRLENFVYLCILQTTGISVLEDPETLDKNPVDVYGPFWTLLCCLSLPLQFGT